MERFYVSKYSFPHNNKQFLTFENRLDIWMDDVKLNTDLWNLRRNQIFNVTTKKTPL